MRKNRILVAEDDNDINGLLKRILEKAGYEVDTAFSGTEALLLTDLHSYDLIVTDLMLPGLSGEEFLAKLRETKKMPVIALSAKSGLDDKVTVLELGADDYLTKPFEKEELLARIKAQLRRAGTYSCVSKEDEDFVSFKNLKLYPESRCALFGEEELSFTTYEFQILEVMMRHPNKVFSKENLYQTVWKESAVIEDNSISVHVSNIRKKIWKFTEEEYIKTVWGIGYKMNL